MKTVLAMLALAIVGLATFATSAEARFRKPRYVCTGDCPGGGEENFGGDDDLPF